MTKNPKKGLSFDQNKHRQRAGRKIFPFRVSNSLKFFGVR